MVQAYAVRCPRGKAVGRLGSVVSRRESSGEGDHPKRAGAKDRAARNAGTSGNGKKRFFLDTDQYEWIAPMKYL